MIEYQSAAEKLEFRKILNRLQAFASSELGKHAAEHLTPKFGSEELAVELNRVDEMKRILESDEPFPIDGIRDIRETLQRAGVENSVLHPAELLPIARTLAASGNIKTYLHKRSESYRELHVLSNLAVANKILEYNITEAIDENGLVKDSASKELKAVRAEMVSMYETLRKQLARILKNVSEQGFAQEDIITTRDGRMVIPVKTEQKNSVPGFIHSSSASGLTVFVEPAETLPLNNAILELHFREQREIEKILRALTEQVREVHLELLSGLDILQHLDLIYAKGRYSIEIKGNKPYLKESGSLKIVDARHPILLLRHPRERIVPLSLEIGTGFGTLLITGPNAGGKSVAMKTVGVLVLMVHSGIHIPASPESEFPTVSKLFVDIGDDQSIENDLSTFSSHVVRLKEILESADNKSLVLIDEIGAGTDPVEGGALAAAVLKRLTNTGAFVIATTHQVALKAFAHETQGIENGAMEFDQESLMPTYKFRLGVPGSSYALEIARRLGVPPTLIAEAEKMVGDQKSRLEKLILDLENRSQKLSKEFETLEAERIKLKSLTIDYETKLAGLKAELSRIKTKAVEEAKEIVGRANSIIEKSVLEIRQHQAEKRYIVESKREIKELKGEILEIEKNLLETEPSAPHENREVTKGSIIRLKANGQLGQVLQEADSNGMIQVAVGSIKMRIHQNEVTPSTKSSFVEQPSFYVPVETATEREIDVRGLYGDEALERVDKFIDTALLSGLYRVDIIHGKGTGALKKKIGAFLTSDSRVKAYRLGEWNEGGAGVTVVELKDE